MSGFSDELDTLLNELNVFIKEKSSGCLSGVALFLETFIHDLTRISLGISLFFDVRRDCLSLTLTGTKIQLSL